MIATFMNIVLFFVYGLIHSYIYISATRTISINTLFKKNIANHLVYGNNLAFSS